MSALRIIDCPAETCEHYASDPCACNGTGRKVAICQYCSADLHEGEGPDDDLACEACSSAPAPAQERRTVAKVRIRYVLYPPMPESLGAATIEAFMLANDVRIALAKWERESA